MLLEALRNSNRIQSCLTAYLIYVPVPHFCYLVFTFPAKQLNPASTTLCPRFLMMMMMMTTQP